MVSKYRFHFKSESIIPAAPIVESFPAPRKTGDAPLITFGNERYYLYTASAFRGKTRRRVFKNIANKLQAVRPEFRFSSADMRLMVIGGVKSSGRSEHLAPAKSEQVRKLRPDLEIYGMNDPTFMGGCLAAGLTTSIAPAPERADSDSTIPIIRRSLLTDRILQDIELSDKGSMEELSGLNHQRSKVEEAIKRLSRLERKGERSSREDRDYTQALATVSEVAGYQITTVDEAEVFIKQMKDRMKEEGHSDVSEANIQTAFPIPGQTPMRNEMYLNQISMEGAGLFLWGWHDAWCFDPAIGGMSARGAGGYLTSVYTVERQEGYEWIADCTLRIVPDTGIEFIGATGSNLLEAFELWRDIDITQYDFTFNALKTFIGEK